MSALLETIEIETAPNPSAAVIWLHGLGADGNDFAPIVPELRIANAPAIRFVFPHAPMMPVTINNGYVMRAWYDVSFGDLEGKTKQADEKGVRASQAEIEKLIAREIARGVTAGLEFHPERNPRHETSQHPRTRPAITLDRPRSGGLAICPARGLQRPDGRGLHSAGAAGQRGAGAGQTGEPVG